MFKTKKVYYNKNFYESNYKNNNQSAVKIIDILLDMMPEEVYKENGKSIVDCGCAAGHWLREFSNRGFDILGIDGSYIDKKLLVIPEDKFYVHNLEEPLNIKRKFTFALSLEVAEHLPEYCADMFVDELTALSDIVIFSAAIPHQRGDGHINEQWPSYWIQKFEKRGFKVVDCIRRKIWADKSIRYYYAQNMFVFCKENGCGGVLDMAKNDSPTQYDLVHPMLWEQLNLYPFMKLIDLLMKNKLIFSIARRLVKK